jgi:hypothetical protein
MTPKEKADELFWKYRPIIAGKQFVTGLVLMSEAKELTKQCALIAVDEIIKVCPYIRQKDWETLQQLNAPNIYFVEYWNEVKQEIEKL